MLYSVLMTTTKEATKRQALEAWFAEVDALLTAIEADKARWAKVAA